MENTKEVIDFSIREVIEFHDEIKRTCVSIEDWRQCVCRFRDKHGLSDQDAMAIASCSISFPHWTSTTKYKKWNDWKKKAKLAEKNSANCRKVSA